MKSVPEFEKIYKQEGMHTHSYDKLCNLLNNEIIFIIIFSFEMTINYSTFQFSIKTSFFNGLIIYRIYLLFCN